MSDVIEKTASPETSIVRRTLQEALFSGPYVLEVEEINLTNTPVANGYVLMTIHDLADIHQADVTIDPRPNLGAGYSPFDINIAHFGHQAGEALRIHIVLADDDLEFRLDERYITAGDSTSCNVLRRVRAPQRREADFYVIRHPNVPTVNFNLGLKFKGVSWDLPIYIDPKIENNG